jgi:signal transduction histidine kinase
MTLEAGTLTSADYTSVLKEYIQTHSEHSLLGASDLSLIFVQNGLGPEDVIALHFESLEQILPTLSPREHARTVGDAHQFLLETMIAYGVRYKEFLELKLQQAVSDAESRAMREQERILEADRIQRESSEILTMIAHELRTPLTAAKSSLDMATRSLSRGQVEPASKFVGSAQMAVERLSRLSADLVEASRGGPHELATEPVSLTAVVEQACAWARPSASSKGITLTVEGTGSPIVINGNSDALLSVLGNLLSNATRYTPSGGAISVRLQTHPGRVVVEVGDTGIGMTPDILPRIFDRFYRAPAAQKVEAQGLGLGLGLVRQMIEAHGGEIEVESSPGQGSLFRVVLPRENGELAQGVDEQTSADEGKDG